ncbi:early nodulin-like protein 19 [Actinidia rufa]|uniref:Early nodulin-like protein 19 n=1 Tax=Actinidia rufa TaxID=165716 RepID=A0A7J0DD97_9ERIC|nr:early nodulin-like protein 19 [Actinidia rufa]
MENLRKGSLTWWTVAVAVVLVMMLPCAVCQPPQLFKVGGRDGWTKDVNYTEWAIHQRLYVGDWLFFVYDRNQMNVLEVNKTDYENCISDHPLHNWTTGAGRDVVAVLVENPPPPPAASPVTDGAPTLNLEGHIVIPAVFAIAAVWNSFFRFW